MKIKDLKNGQCYKHNKFNVFKQITNAKERKCIHIALEDHKQISTGIFHVFFEAEFSSIEKNEFEKAKTEVLAYFKNLKNVQPTHELTNKE